MSKTLTLLLVGFIGFLSPVSEATAKPKYKKALDRIVQCESITLPRCPALGKYVDLGEAAIPFAIQTLQANKSIEARKAAGHALQFFPQKEALRALAVQATKERNSKVRKAIVHALEVRGNAPLLKTARELYKEKEPGMRVMASNLIGLLRVKGAAADLIAASKDPIPRVQYAALSAMGRIGEEAPVDALMQLISIGSTPWTIQHKAISSLAELQIKEAAPLIFMALAHEEGQLRTAAADALARFDAQWSIPALVNELQNPDSAGPVSLALGTLNYSGATKEMVAAIADERISNEGKFQVLWALGSLEDTASAPALIALLGTADNTLAYQICHALGRMKASGAVIALIMRLNSENQEVKDISLWSLEKITEQKLGYDSEKWLAWHKAQKTPAP